jgi:adenine deaminase
MISRFSTDQKMSKMQAKGENRSMSTTIMDSAMPEKKDRLIDAARGMVKADAVFSNAELFNPFTCEWERGSFAITDGVVVGVGKYQGLTEHDMGGARIVPGLIDAHVHIESSLVTPGEYARLVSSHGTTTVVADPHEIANVAGIDGIEFMLRETNDLPVDIFYMLPSCVPATPRDQGGAVLSAKDLRPFIGRPRVLGIGEVMNVPGVLAHDHQLLEKIALSGVVDGHAPLLSGSDLNAYVLAGMQSDHECTRIDEAVEKLRRGMYIFLRQGSTEHNISDLAGIVNARTVPRCCFATDDCHADMLADAGHIDNCIRVAVESGIELEHALRMATLSAAERFGLSDRGAIAPGRLADFCVISDSRIFTVKTTCKRGVEQGGIPRKPLLWKSDPFLCSAPAPDMIRLEGRGRARVIGIIPHQIITEPLVVEIDTREIPDLARDILKVVVCNRYRDRSCGAGLVHGFGLLRGAIASSVSHDAHNIVAVGTSDDEILRAIDTVIRTRGAMVVVDGQEKTSLPLGCAGLMSLLPYEEVVSQQETLKSAVSRLGAVADPFMYLSFIALTVIPDLRITDRGVFDVGQFADVPLFLE